MSALVDRIHTTHTGSLPRPDDLLRMVWAQADGVPVDAKQFDACVAKAVGEIVDKQIAAGLSIINDGEMSKPSYATYVKDRLHGFGGSAVESYYFADLAAYPKSQELVAANPGRRKRHAPACNAPISVKDPRAAELDMQNLTRAAADAPVAGLFSSAASPGVVSLFFANEHYPSDETYVFAIAEAMRHEYEAIAQAGATVQLDCPDLAMGRHSSYASLDLPAFRRRLAMNVEALNHAVRNIPAERLRMHLCWGNYPGPHHCDVPLADIIDLVWTAKPSTILFEAANPRHAHEWTVFENVRVPDGKVLCPDANV
jgi:5-methyltetrahydropteroyltriglutamate--homocysteine methyltransferase